MESQPLSKILKLTATQRASLKRAQILTVADVLLISISDLAKRCRIVYREAQNIVDAVCEELAPRLQPHTLSDPETRQDQKITTGDSLLDKALGGGIRTGKVWEIVGQSAAGKSQLCMQMLLSVQLPRSLGGVSGAACILSTSWTLPTNRLLQMVDAHPNFSESLCSLSDIHTVKTPTIPALIHVLSIEFHKLTETLATQPFAKPVKLLIVDALTELFHSDTTVSTLTLSERSKNLAEISTLLHRLASTHNIAVIVVNEVVDVIDRGPAPAALPYEVIYQDQARLFNRADSIPGESRREAALGLSWANQVNARIMLSRTTRLRHLEQAEVPSKRRRLNSGDAEPREADKPTLIRRLTVIFNSLAPPTSLDYIVTAGGVVMLPTEVPLDSEANAVERPAAAPVLVAKPIAGVAGVSPLDIPLAEAMASQDVLSDDDPQFESLPGEHGSSQASTRVLSSEDGPQDEDEWDAYWREAEADFGSDLLTDIDTDNPTPRAPARDPK